MGVKAAAAATAATMLCTTRQMVSLRIFEMLPWWSI
jgi:hypothetical protein